MEFYLVFFVALIILIALIFLLKKVIRIDKEIWGFELKVKNIMYNEFQQMQAINALVSLLKPTFPLPTTRGWAASPDFLLELAQYTLEKKPINMIECSCGTSTIVMARCAQLNGFGHVYSLEHNPEYAKITRDNLKKYNLDSFATVIDAPLVKENSNKQWYSINNLPEKVFDLIVIDGPPTTSDPLARLPAGPMLFSCLGRHGAIFLDDANRQGERESIDFWLKEFDELDCQIIPCEKGLAKLFYRN